MDEEQVVQQEEQVAEDSTPETPVEQVEQRTDDYDATKRRLDDVLDMLSQVLDGIKRIEGVTGAFVEAGATVSEDSVGDIEETETSFNDIAAAEAAEVIDIDDLDLM